MNSHSKLSSHSRKIFAAIRDSMTPAQRDEIRKMAHALEAAADEIEAKYAEAARLELASNKPAKEIDQVKLRRLVEKMQDEFALLQRIRFAAPYEQQTAPDNLRPNGDQDVDLGGR